MTNLNINNLTFDEPIIYRDLNIYPVRLRDYYAFYGYADCFLTDKNSIPDAKVISMKELEYLHYITQKEKSEKPYIYFFDRILSLCLRDNDSFENPQKSIVRFYLYKDLHNPYFLINNKKYYDSDYKNIKRIICMQNLVDLPDENISKDVRDSLENALSYKNKSDENPATLEDYIISLSVVTGWKLEYIYEMSIRKFIKSVRRFDHYMHYKIFMSASMSGMVEFKDKSVIKSWLSGLEKKDKYKDVSLGLEEFRRKLSLEDAK